MVRNIVRRQVLWMAAIGLVAGWLSVPAVADNLADAQLLLRIADTGEAFETRARQQANQLIYNYSVIINRNTDYRLPGQLQQRIAACYEIVYRWENFEAGIARILADNFSAEELSLLIDFHRNLGMPPNKIDLFRTTIAKAGSISEQSADYIFSNSQGCVGQDIDLILEHLRTEKIELVPL